MATSMNLFSSTRMVQIYLTAAILLGAAAMVQSPPGIFSDSVSGFLVLQSMERGAPFNHTLHVDPDSIKTDLSEFTSWWVPGQYLVAWPLLGLGFDLGQSLALVTIVVWCLGLWGYLLFFRRLGLSEWESWASLALVISQPYVLGYARFYHGGDLLQWGYFPWFALATLASRNLKWRQVPLLLLWLGIGVFLKSSFLILGSLTLGALFIIRFRDARYRISATVMLDGLKIGLIVAGAALALFAYSSLGESPLGERSLTVLSINLKKIAFAAAAPLNSLFGLWQLYIPDVESTEWMLGNIGGPLALFTLAGLGLLVVIVRFVDGFESYKILFCVLYAGVVSSFAIAYSLGLEISFQVRHFRIAGLLFLPGVVILIQQIRAKPIRRLLIGGFSAYCIAALILLWFPLSRDPSNRPIGAAGFSHIYAKQGFLNALRNIDDQLGNGNNLIAVPWPQFSLDIQKTRTLNMRKIFLSPGSFSYAMYYGRVDNLVVVIPIEMEEEERYRLILDAFKEHEDWRRIHPELEEFMIMHSGTHPGFN